MGKPDNTEKILAEGDSKTSPTAITTRKVVPSDRHDCDPLTLEEVRKLVEANNHSGQPEAAIVCQIYKESSFFPCAKSRTSTAAGLMGVTVTAIMDIIGRNSGETKEQWRARAAVVHASMTPAANIEYGTQYLKLRIGWSKRDITAGTDGYGTGAGTPPAYSPAEIAWRPAESAMRA